MTRKCLVVDLNRCIGCFACDIACKTAHDVDLGVYWSRVVTVGPTGTFPDIEEYWLPTMCQQCVNAPCIEVCPTGASYRDDGGVVLIDEQTCIGCQLCVTACPYGVRSYNSDKAVVEKCNLCVDRVAQGEDPKCVMACCAEARFYGDLDDPDSDASKALAAADEADVHRLADSGNQPSAAYILSEKVATWRSEGWVSDGEYARG
ncbi:MAG: 4Fe-4S dicluster domain-containing protein [Coriobacteriales bacterium]|jgi:Fe-S-cluster-containing dehydrogenase component